MILLVQRENKERTVTQAEKLGLDRLNCLMEKLQHLEAQPVHDIQLDREMGLSRITEARRSGYGSQLNQGGRLANLSRSSLWKEVVFGHTHPSRGESHDGHFLHTLLTSTLGK